jgi:iron complex outermembrane receptor protein
MNDQNSKLYSPIPWLILKHILFFLSLKKIRAVLSAGANNLTNKRYAASILPNAVVLPGTTTILLSGKSSYYYGGLAV